MSVNDGGGLCVLNRHAPSTGPVAKVVRRINLGSAARVRSSGAWSVRPTRGIGVKRVLLFLLFAGAALAGIVVWLRFPHGASLSEKTLTFANIQYGSMVDVVSAT